MLTSDKLKELEEKKKAAIAAIDAEIEQIKSLAKASEEFSALVAKYKFPNASEFLKALNLIPAASAPAPKAKKAPANPAPAGEFKRGPFSEAERGQIKKLHDDDKLTPAEIAAKMKRKEAAIVKILNDEK